MKSFFVYAIAAGIFLFSASLLRAGPVDQSGPGNGTDYAKILFAEAQLNVVRMLTPVTETSLDSLGLSQEVKDWLTARSQGDSHLGRIKYWLRIMDLRFQQEPCTDFTKRPASICYFNDGSSPYVMVSLQENKMTTLDQAMAMLIHEAGHFAGEPDHLLLDRVGVALVAALRLPAYLFADAESSDIVANPFLATDNCEKGEGSQAAALRDRVRLALLRQCSERGVICDPAKISFAFQGENHFQEMKVTCLARGVISIH